MTTQFYSNLPNVKQEVCIEPSNIKDGQVPQIITVTYQKRFPYNYRFSRIDNKGNYCYILIVVAAFGGRKKKKSIPCPTICVVGHFKNRTTTPCSSTRQTMTDASVDFPYTNTLIASGGSSPYSYTVISGTLPVGLSIIGDTISGTPTDAGGGSLKSDFTIQATDANGCTGIQDFSITVFIV